LRRIATPERDEHQRGRLIDLQNRPAVTTRERSLVYTARPWQTVLMARVRLVHWKPDEATRLIGLLRVAGHCVDYDAKFDLAHFRANLPDAVVIDLSRVPSHGRDVAIYLRVRKSTRHIPIVFVDGLPEKVETIRLKLPDAVYATSGRLRQALAHALKNAPPKPIVPPHMMESYAGRGAARKLGIRESSTVALIDPPRGYAKAPPTWSSARTPTSRAP
jgi:CheY-like chemotaxis protein